MPRNIAVKIKLKVAGPQHRALHHKQLVNNPPPHLLTDRGTDLSPMLLLPELDDQVLDSHFLIQGFTGDEYRSAADQLSFVFQVGLRKKKEIRVHHAHRSGILA